VFLVFSRGQFFAKKTKICVVVVQMPPMEELLEENDLVVASPARGRPFCQATF
jgi:hypothetical protein